MSFAVIGSPASSVAVTASGFQQVLLLGSGGGIDPGIVGRAEFGGHLLEMLARVFSGTRGDFRCQQAEDETIFVGSQWYFLIRIISTRYVAPRKHLRLGGSLALPWLSNPHFPTAVGMSFGNCSKTYIRGSR